jgi:hypothetical protein
MMNFILKIMAFSGNYPSQCMVVLLDNENDENPGMMEPVKGAYTRAMVTLTSFEPFGPETVMVALVMCPAERTDRAAVVALATSGSDTAATRAPSRAALVSMFDISHNLPNSMIPKRMTMNTGRTRANSTRDCPFCDFFETLIGPISSTLPKHFLFDARTEIFRHVPFCSPSIEGIEDRGRDQALRSARFLKRPYHPHEKAGQPLAEQGRHDDGDDDDQHENQNGFSQSLSPGPIHD